MNHLKPIQEYERGPQRDGKNIRREEPEMTGSCNVHMEHNTSPLRGAWNIINT